MGHMWRPVEPRLWSRVQKTDGCWLWTGPLSPVRRYPTIRFHGRTRPAHVVSWLLVNGEVPDGLELDHLCRNKRCVRPDHLEPVTHLENVRRFFDAERRNCRRGHGELSVTRWGRICRPCRREANVRYRQRQAAMSV